LGGDHGDTGWKPPQSVAQGSLGVGAGKVKRIGHAARDVWGIIPGYLGSLHKSPERGQKTANARGERVRAVGCVLANTGRRHAGRHVQRHAPGRRPAGMGQSFLQK